VGKLKNGQLSRGYIYKDGLNPVAEIRPDTNGQPELKNVFVYASRKNVPDFMIHFDDASNRVVYRIVSDPLGSVRLVVDIDTGTIAQRMDYTPFGIVTTDTAPGFQPFGFGGGLYDPETGRWTAKDPILFAGGDTNLYGYVLGDPSNLNDSDGLTPDYYVPGANRIGSNNAYWDGGGYKPVVSEPKYFQQSRIGFHIANFLFGALDYLFGFGLFESPVDALREVVENPTWIDPCSSAYKAGQFSAWLGSIAVSFYNSYNVATQYGKLPVAAVYGSSYPRPFFGTAAFSDVAKISWWGSGFGRGFYKIFFPPNCERFR
jgi:RHS repeat-associated protein